MMTRFEEGTIVYAFGNDDGMYDNDPVETLEEARLAAHEMADQDRMIVYIMEYRSDGEGGYDYNDRYWTVDPDSDDEHEQAD